MLRAVPPVTCQRMSVANRRLLHHYCHITGKVWYVTSSAAGNPCSSEPQKPPSPLYLDRNPRVDCLSQVWDVTLQHCSQTLIGFKGEVWSLDVDPLEQRLVAGCVDSDLRVYVIRAADDVILAQDDATQQQPGSDDEDVLPESLLATAAAAAAAGEQQQRRQHDVLVPMGTVRRAGQERVSVIRYNVTGQLLGVMGAGKGVEIFR